MRKTIPFMLIVMLSLTSLVHANNYRDLGYLYFSPQPDAEYTSPQTRFFLVRFTSILPSELINLSSFITVQGTGSGLHPGQTKIASDNKTVIHEVTGDFIRNELVTVSLNPQLDIGQRVEPYSYQFMISGPMPGATPTPMVLASLQTQSIPAPIEQSDQTLENDSILPAYGGPTILPNGVSIPGDFPQVNIFTNNNPAPGYIFIDYNVSSIPYFMILDNDGYPVWYQRDSRGRDFKIQKNGTISAIHVRGESGFTVYDYNFNKLYNRQAVNGYGTDDHELQILENGGYFLIGLRSESVDMSRYVVGGRTSATVHESVLQEFTAEGDLIFQWRSWDHHDIRLMEYWSYDDKPTSQSIRFVHMNAVDVDNDNNLVLSNKRISEITKIDRNSGEVIWRLGSGNPVDPDQDLYRDQRLTIKNDPYGQFNVQHDVRVVGENRYSVFDNHWLDRQSNSRAVEYEVDPVARTANLVWQYREDPPYGSYHMGSAQRLPNGNTLINWVEASYPKVTEIRPDGTKAFEMNWDDSSAKSYRTFRFPWHGIVEKPYLLLESYTDNITLIFNKFGDPDINHYNIYAGFSPQPTTLLTTSDQTLIQLNPELDNGRLYFFRVTAVDSNGVESDYSDDVSAVVNFIRHDGEMIMNGSFFLDQNWWNNPVASPAGVNWFIEGGVARFDILSPGTSFPDIQLIQDGLRLIQGTDYILEFDVWSAYPRLIEVKVEQQVSPYVNYSKSTFVSISPSKKRQSITFAMTNASDFDARLVFNLGASIHDVYLDNISLKSSDSQDQNMTIALVSDSMAPGSDQDERQEDDELVVWLQNRGFYVDTTCMSGAAKDGNNPFSNPVIVAAIQNADLILVSRRTNSGDYDATPQYWNAIPKPLVLCSGYLSPSSKWYWTPCGSSDAKPASTTDLQIVPGHESHPFFKGVANPVSLFDWSESPNTGVWPTNVFLPDCEFDGQNTVLGLFANQPVLTDMPAGTQLSNNNILGGRRIYLGHWSYDVDLGAPYNRQANWNDFITNDYKRLLLNIILVSLNLNTADLNFDGCVAMDDLLILSDDWLNNGDSRSDLKLDGKVDMFDFITLGDNWMQSCP